MPLFFCIGTNPDETTHILQLIADSSCCQPGGEQNDLQWHFGDNALWLHAPGAMSPDGDKAWEVLVEHYGEKLGGRLIGGIVCVLDAERLLSAERDTLRHDALQLRQRANALSSLLRADIPVYLCIGGIDRLYGMQSLAHACTKKRIELPLGAFATGKEDQAGKFATRTILQAAAQLGFATSTHTAAAFQATAELRRLAAPAAFFCDIAFRATANHFTGYMRGLFLHASERRGRTVPSLLAESPSFTPEREPAVPESWFLTETLANALPHDSRTAGIGPVRKGLGIAVVHAAMLALCIFLTSAFIEAKQVIELAARDDVVPEYIRERNTSWPLPRFGLDEPLLLEKRVFARAKIMDRMQAQRALREDVSVQVQASVPEQPLLRTMHQLAMLVEQQPGVEPVDTAPVWWSAQSGPRPGDAQVIAAAWTDRGYAAAEEILSAMEPRERARLLHEYRREALSQWQIAATLLWAAVENMPREHGNAFAAQVPRLHEPPFRFALLAGQHLFPMFADEPDNQDILWLRQFASLTGRAGESRTLSTFRSSMTALAEQCGTAESCLELVRRHSRSAIAMTGYFAEALRAAEHLDRTTGTASGSAWPFLRWRGLVELVHQRVSAEAARHVQSLWYEQVFQPSQLLGEEERQSRLIGANGFMEKFLIGPALGLWRMVDGRLVDAGSGQHAFSFTPQFLDYCNWAVTQGKRQRPETLLLPVGIESVSVNPEAREKPIGLDLTWIDKKSEQSIRYQNFTIQGQLLWSLSSTPRLAVTVHFPAFSLRREFQGKTALRQILAAFAQGGVHWTPDDFPEQKVALINMGVDIIVMRSWLESPEEFFAWLDFSEPRLPEWIVVPAGVDPAASPPRYPPGPHRVPGPAGAPHAYASLALPVEKDGGDGVPR